MHIFFSVIQIPSSLLNNGQLIQAGSTTGSQMNNVYMVHNEALSSSTHGPTTYFSLMFSKTSLDIQDDAQ